MITLTLSFILFVIFLTLGAFHFYWLFGGVWGLKSVIPSKEDQPKNHVIPPFATLIVALGLTSFGIIYLLKTNWIHFELPQWISKSAYWFIPSVFLLRAIGEFKYVGMFKKIKNTSFAKVDTKIFVPLCLFIGVAGFVIQLLTF